MAPGRGSKKNFDSILKEIRDGSKSKADLGARFEDLTLKFLKADVTYKRRLSNVVRWKNWKHKATVSPRGGDIGVDLMADDEDGSLCAIQCKCYDDDGNLDYKTLSTFFSTAESIERRLKKKVRTILVYTGDRITPNADKAIQIKNCHLISQDTFSRSSVMWDDLAAMRARDPKELKKHQKTACMDVLEGLKTADRGKLIMACGTGKTLTSLRIAEAHAGKGKAVLYLVPSISLIHQTLREWSENAKVKPYYTVVCSDKTAGMDEDRDTSQIPISPTTDKSEIKKSFAKRPKDAMGVVFSTYQSLSAASEALGGEPFDLILCDEAHRTAGAEKLDRSDPAVFTQVHDDKNVKGKKRLYMTATPRIYKGEIRDKANVHSMDDPAIYGEELHKYSFERAVEDGQLSDFKVRVPVISEDDLARYTNESIDDLHDDDGTIDERVLLAAMWYALNYDNDKNRALLRRVISFSNKIPASRQFAGVYRGDDPTQDEEAYEKKLNKREDDDRIRGDRSLVSIVSKYEETSSDRTGNRVSVRHIDGSMRASIRSNKLRWLKDEEQDGDECRILSNARCLSEGVDVPALDAVIFLQPRGSTIDVVQSVGRVMRKAEGKDYGYVILPVVVPSGSTLEQSIHDNKTWLPVWKVLNALRAHNPRLVEKIGRVNLDRGPGGFPSKLENVEIIYMGSYHRAAGEHEMFGKLVTKMVEKVGDRMYFDDQARILGEKAREMRDIITRVYNNKSHVKVVEAVNTLRNGLRAIINDSIGDKATIDVLAQHHALSQVFDTLFPREFRSANPVAAALDDAISGIGLKRELEGFGEFYDEIRKTASRFEHYGGKQQYIKKIYGNFLLGFDKKRQESEGIVYTPDVAIDFIIHSIQDVLNSEFSTGFGRNDVKVFDPFTGTGAFVTRLLESKIIRKDKILSKYANDIWANEINLLAYYVASVNIESVFSRVMGSDTHVPFRNISYTDTLNHNPRYRLDREHRRSQKALDGKWKRIRDDIQRGQWAHIHVIMGNPPYSAGQSNYNDNNPNMAYPEVDKRIKETYAHELSRIKRAHGPAKTLHDSYVRSIRWASDRIGSAGIIGLITNSSFIRSGTASGIRICLQKEFNDVWIFDLKGNQRTKGDVSKKEGGKIFGSGSRAPVAIVIFVKNPKKKTHTIHYKDIGDYHSREKKLEIIKKYTSIKNITDWENITPDNHGDWLDKRNDAFSNYTPIGSKNEKCIFKLYSLATITNRDVWVYNSSKTELLKNMKTHIDYSNEQSLVHPIFNPKKAKLTNELLKKIKRFGKQKLDHNKARSALYRPFFKQYLYFDNVFINSQFRMADIFPNRTSENMAICIPYKFIGEFSTFVTNIIPDTQPNYRAQCFPIYVYKNNIRHDNITDESLLEYRTHYGDQRIKKVDIFYYVYGILHHEGYRTKYSNNLTKELPHIPMAPDFWAFSRIGKKLADLHLSWETCKRYDLGSQKAKFGKYEEMDYGKKKAGKKSAKDTSTLRINKTVVFDNIPEVKYRINGRTPLDWAIYRYKRTVDEESGIINDATDIDPIPLIERLVYVGVESDVLISQLPQTFEPKDWKPRKTGMDAHLPE